MSKSAVLLLNLGSPASTRVPDVRRYLREFLSDPRVLDAPAPIRWFVLNLFILPWRPKKSAEAYSKVWTPEGAPLVVVSEKQRQQVAEQIEVPVALAMRYGEPSVEGVIAELAQEGVCELFVCPLYPHYAMSSYETALVQVTETLARVAPEMRTSLLQPFYQHPEYIDALAEVTRPYLETPYDKLLFSFHGVPERHLRKSDPSHAHCLTVPDCCNRPHPAHATCYRHQCFRTVQLLSERLGLAAEKFQVSFQSRLGRDPWLRPYTDETLRELGQAGAKRVLVITPAFVTDCLETLEEIAMAGAETFQEAGGEELVAIPCLNEHPAWIGFLVKRIAEWQGGRLASA